MLVAICANSLNCAGLSREKIQNNRNYGITVAEFKLRSKAICQRRSVLIPAPDLPTWNIPARERTTADSSGFRLRLNCELETRTSKRRSKLALDQDKYPKVVHGVAKCLPPLSQRFSEQLDSGQ